MDKSNEKCTKTNVTGNKCYKNKDCESSGALSGASSDASSNASGYVSSDASGDVSSEIKIIDGYIEFDSNAEYDNHIGGADYNCIFDMDMSDVVCTNVSLQMKDGSRSSSYEIVHIE